MPTKLEVGPEAHHSNISLNDILFAIFKHKGKVLLGAIAGVVAATTVYFLYPRTYESQAKLLVRYVLDRSPVDEGATGSSYGKSTENVISSEAEILNSWDLAAQVAEAIGPKRLLPELGDAATKTAAATIISSGLEVVTRRGSDIIFVSYKNKDPELATLVLDELVNRYFTKHLEVHRSAAAFDFVTQQSDQVRARLSATEDALRDLKAKAGVTSVADNTATLSADVVKIEDQYLAAETELAEQTARVKELEGSFDAGGPDGTGTNSTKQKPADKTGGPASSGATDRKATSGEIQQYQALVARLAQLRQARLDMLSKYTPENELVKLNQLQINNNERQRRDLEKKFSDLAGQAPAASQGQPIDIGSERTRLAGIQAKVETLKSRLQERIKQLSDVGSQIAALERKKELEEANYKYFQAAVEKARVDEALDPSKMPNISTVQKPSPPTRVVGKRDKIVLLLAGGGAALGLAFALLNELILNRTVKRPLELENRLRAPLLVSIPYSAPRDRLRASSKKSRWDSELVLRSNGRSNVAPWEADHFMRPYAEAIRDRLNLYFELNRMTHKPKLVGVTGLTEGAGASTLAAGLAAALSEMGEGKVLLVDVNLAGGEVHPFFKGRLAYPLSTALQPSGAIDSASDNLYLATVAPPGAGPMQIALKKFFDLMPNLKASDFDYIIFDMPTLTQTSPTLGMAGFMDKLLLIAEAEKTNRDTVTRSYAQLTAARANVSVVLNKTRSYVPEWLNGES